MGLASFPQQAAMARQQAATPAQVEIPFVGRLPQDSSYRKASF